MPEYYQVVRCCKCGAGDNWLGTITTIIGTVPNVAGGKCIRCGQIYMETMAQVDIPKGPKALPRSFLSKLPPVNDEKTEREKELEIK